MNRLFQYIDVLKLDNLLQTLTEQERLEINLFRAGKTEKIPLKALLLNEWIEDNHWQPPEFKFSDSRELLYKENGQWFPIEKHPLYKANLIMG